MHKAMQGCWGGNRCWRWFTCLTGLWLAGGLVGVRAQAVGPAALPYYVPRSMATDGVSVENTPVVAYESWSDLAAKLAGQAGEPYHLTLLLDNVPPGGWKILRTVPPATQLSVALADSIMSDSLLSVLATWPALKTMQVAGVPQPRSFTLVTNAKGETVFGNRPTARRLATHGWADLKALERVNIADDIELSQALSVLQELPALNELVLQQFMPDGKPEDVPAALAGLRRLRKLTIQARNLVQNYAVAFRGLANLTELTINGPDVADFNASLVYLPNLQTLDITCFPANKLRLGPLTKLEKLRLTSPPNYSRARNGSANLPPAGVSLDSTLAGLTTLKRLEMAGLKLASFPANLLANRGLMYLAVANLELKRIPESIGQLTVLEELILDGNPLRQLPETLGQLTRLHRLSASQCELDSLPVTLGGLVSLTSLSVNTNLLTALPASVGRLKNLRQINVAMNQLTNLPDELGTLLRLEIVAAFWNRINRFPMALRQVHELYLSDNQLGELPATLGTLNRLQTLLLDNNPLASLPASIGQLDSLEALTLGGNQLTQLPASLGSLRRLTRFELGTNQIRSLPETLGGLASLTSVSLHDNPIEQLPGTVGGWKNLKSLRIQLAQLVALPRQMSQWQALNQLTIEGDRLLILPDELGDCVQLTYLSVTGKRLVGLPESIRKLSRLTELSISGRADSLTGRGLGQLLALPAGLAGCTALNRFTVRDQQAFDWPESMPVLLNRPALESLFITNCGITDLAGRPWKNLLVTRLHMNQNPIIQLPASLLDMPNLTTASFVETGLPMALGRYFFSRTDLVNSLKKEGSK